MAAGGGQTPAYSTEATTQRAVNPEAEMTTSWTVKNNRTIAERNLAAATVQDVYLVQKICNVIAQLSHTAKILRVSLNKD